MQSHFLISTIQYQRICTKKTIKGKFDYKHTDTFMGFHCGNTCSKKLAKLEMKYQMIMARSLPDRGYKRNT